MVSIKKSITLVVLILISSSLSEIRIESPKNLKAYISDKDGLLNYSVSTFGFLDY